VFSSTNTNAYPEPDQSVSYFYSTSSEGPDLIASRHLLGFQATIYWASPQKFYICFLFLLSELQVSHYVTSLIFLCGLEQRSFIMLIFLVLWQPWWEDKSKCTQAFSLVKPFRVQGSVIGCSTLRRFKELLFVGNVTNIQSAFQH
jgi:hypothetical protein